MTNKPLGTAAFLQMSDRMRKTAMLGFDSSRRGMTDDATIFGVK